MSSKRVVRIVSAIGLCVLLVGVSGCKKPAPEVTSAWPVAKGERVVPEPPPVPRWPYTGEDAPDLEAVAKRPLSVKIENSSAARPQKGLSSADVVYESIAEGGITRFNCIFHSTVPKTLGPVRSARLSDLWIVPQYDGLFFFSGASGSVEREVNKAGIDNLSQDAGVYRPYWRASDRHAPHNLMLDTEKAYAEAEKRKYETTAELQALQFQRGGTDVTETVSTINVPFSQANYVRWEYDESSDSYLRWNNGNVHKDATSGKQVNADNVVVLWAKYTEARKDMVGSRTYKITLGGKGRATIFRNGVRIDGLWLAKRDAPPRFQTRGGAAIKLAPGRTWFQVIPLDTDISMK